MADVLTDLHIGFPDEPGNQLYMIPAFCTLRQIWAAFTLIPTALIFPLAVSVCCAVAEDLIVRTQVTVIVYNDSYIETDADQIMYATRINRSMCDDLLATDARISSLDEMISSGKTIMDKVFFSFIDPEDIARCVNWLGKFANISYGYSTKYSVEIFPRNSNKDVALDYLCKYLSIPKENTIAIGDSENDVSMIQYASFGVAVENSMKVLKEAADYIAPSNDKDGPAQVLEEIMTGSQLMLQDCYHLT